MLVFSCLIGVAWFEAEGLPWLYLGMVTDEQ